MPSQFPASALPAAFFFRLPACRTAAVLCGVTALLLSGCAVNTTVVDPLTMPTASAGNPVAVSITANTNEIAGFDTIKLRRVVAGEKRATFKLVAENLVMTKVVRGMARDTSLFIGALPSGEYEFVELIDRSSNKLLRVYSGVVGSFKVETGKSTDLGRLVVTRANLNVDFGRSALTVSNVDLLQRFAPQYGKMFGTDASSGWTDARSAHDNVEEFARAHPAGANCPTEMPDGRVAAASRMGAVLLRSTQGVWSTINSRLPESLSCVLTVDLPDAELLAVGEFGTLLRKPRNVDQLLPVDTGNLPPGNLLRIGGNASDGWYLMHRMGENISVFHSRRLEAGDWKAVHQFEVSGSWLYGPDSFWAWQDARGMGYALLDGLIVEVDYSTGKWSERSAPRKAKLYDFTHLPNGTESVLIPAGFAGKFPDAYISRDRGRNWTQIGPPFKLLSSPAIPLAEGRLLMQSGVYSAKRELLTTADEGKTWASYADYPLAGAPLVLPSGLMLNVVGGYSGLIGIHVSPDHGKTWKMEHSNLELGLNMDRLKK